MTADPRWLAVAWRWLPAAGCAFALGGVALLQQSATSWWAFAALGCGGAYALRDRWPAWALALVLLVIAAARLPGADVLTDQFDVVFVLLLFLPVLPLVAAATAFPPRRSWLALAGTAAVTIAICPDPAWSTENYAGSALAVAWVLTVGVPVALALVAWLVGCALQSRQQYAQALLDRAAALERTRAAEAGAAVVAERARIARELHDVITHTVAVMVVQASAADAVWERDPDRARQALKAVEESGRTVMADLRGMLGAMRDEVPLQAPPGLDALPELAEQIRRAGLGAELVLAGPVEAVPPAAGLSLLRIAQESVTNALRHAGASRIAIGLDVEPDAVRLSITDDGHGILGTSGGHGLRGMRERADALGGTLAIGPGAAGGTVVAARVPLRGPA